MRSDGDATLVEVFHALSGHRVAALRTEADAQVVHSNPSFTRLAVATAAGKVEVFALPEARRVAHLDATVHPSNLEFLDDSVLWACFDSRRRHFAWDLAKGARLWDQTFPDGSRFDRVDDRLFYTSPHPKKRDALGTLELRTGRRAAPRLLDSTASSLAALSRNSVAVATGDRVTVFDANTLRPNASIKLDALSINLSRRPPDGVQLRIWSRGKEDPVTRVWRPGSREALPNAPRDDSPRTAAMVDDLFGPVFQEDPSGVVAFLSDAGTLVVRSPDGREKRAVRPPPAELSGAAIVPNGAALLVGDDRGIRRLSLRSAALGWLGARGLPSSNLGYSRDGHWLLATGSRIVLLDAATGTIRHETAHASMLDARLSADGQQVVAVGSDGALVWDLPSGKTLTHAREAEDPLGVALRATATCCAGSYTLGPDTSAYTKTRAEYFTGAIGLSGDGKRLAIGHIGVQSPRSDNDSEADDDRDIGVLVVDVASRKVLRALSTKGAWPGPIFDEVVLDDEGRRVAASSPMGVTLLWNVDNDQRFELGAMISELSFSRDGKLLVGMTDASAVLWRTTDGVRLGTFVLSKTDPDSGVFISADGRVEWLGKPQSVHVYCEAGRTELPFEVCEDRLLEPGLVARTLR
jgi:hypothetical protein